MLPFFILFFSLCDQWSIYRSSIFLPETRSNLRRTTGDVYICLKKFNSTTPNVYTRPLNKLFLKELVAELKTKWLRTWDIGYLGMICNISEYDIHTWPQVMSLQRWLPTKLPSCTCSYIFNNRRSYRGNFCW